MLSLAGDGNLIIHIRRYVKRLYKVYTEVLLSQLTYTFISDSSKNHQPLSNVRLRRRNGQQIKTYSHVRCNVQCFPRYHLLTAMSRFSPVIIIVANNPISRSLIQLLLNRLPSAAVSPPLPPGAHQPSPIWLTAYTVSLLTARKAAATARWRTATAVAWFRIYCASYCRCFAVGGAPNALPVSWTVVQTDGLCEPVDRRSVLDQFNEQQTVLIVCGRLRLNDLEQFHRKGIDDRQDVIEQSCVLIDVGLRRSIQVCTCYRRIL